MNNASRGSGSISPGPAAVSAPQGRRCGRRPATSVPCQVPGCAEDLAGTDGKNYYRRYRVCRGHCTSPSVQLGGTQQRFCQQCARFQGISEFDGARRSCRAALARHRTKRHSSGRRRSKSGLRAAAVDAQADAADSEAAVSGEAAAPAGCPSSSSSRSGRSMALQTEEQWPPQALSRTLQPLRQCSASAAAELEEPTGSAAGCFIKPSAVLLLPPAVAGNASPVTSAAGARNPHLLPLLPPASSLFSLANRDVTDAVMMQAAFAGGGEAGRHACMPSLPLESPFAASCRLAPVCQVPCLAAAPGTCSSSMPVPGGQGTGMLGGKQLELPQRSHSWPASAQGGHERQQQQLQQHWYQCQLRHHHQPEQEQQRAERAWSVPASAACAPPPQQTQPAANRGAAPPAGWCPNAWLQPAPASAAGLPIPAPGAPGNHHQPCGPQACTPVWPDPSLETLLEDPFDVLLAVQHW
ncbi:hypothetical protein ABPG75_010488 [Micractinium tetrahymenae]